MIYIDAVDLYSQMLHAKFQNHRPFGSEEEDFKRFLLFKSHLGRVTWTIYIKDAPHSIWF